MDKTFTFAFSQLYESVARQLSIISKRSVSDDGKSLFGDITIGTREKDIVADFLINAVVDLTSRFSALITSTQDNAGSGINKQISITITVPSNWNNALYFPLEKAMDNYCINYTLYSWFTVTAPKIAEKYLADSQNQLVSVVRLIHEKKEPSAATSNPVDINTSVAPVTTSTSSNT